jgi:hypothetical protein
VAQSLEAAITPLPLAAWEKLEDMLEDAQLEFAMWSEYDDVIE